MTRYKAVICVLGIGFSVARFVQAVLIGSNTAPVRFTTQQPVNNGDVIAAFAALGAGFNFVNSSVIGTYGSFFSTSGNVDLNGGTLVLTQDLILSNTSAIVHFGNIVGGGFVTQLAATNGTIPTTLLASNSFTISNLDLILANDTILNSTVLTFTGSSTVDGAGNIFTLNGTAALVAGTSSTLTLRNMTIKGVTGTNIRNTDTTGTINFENIRLVLAGTFTFAQGAFTVGQNVSFAGNTQTFVYTSTQISTILDSSTLLIDQTVTFSYAPSVALRDRLQFTNSTSTLKLNSGTLQASSVGMSLTKGVLFVDGASLLASDATTSSNAIQFGDGVSLANNCQIIMAPGASLDLVRGYVSMNNL